MNKPLPDYKTTDVTIATYIAMNGHSVSIELVNKTKGTFVFQNIPRELIIEFTNGRACVEPMAFALKMRQLISAVRQKINDANFSIQ